MKLERKIKEEFFCFISYLQKQKSVYFSLNVVSFTIFKKFNYDRGKNCFRCVKSERGKLKRGDKKS